MNVSRILIRGLIMSVCTISLSSFAEPNNSKQFDDRTESSLAMGRAQFFFGVRPWATSWDVPLVDIKTVIINPVGPVAAFQEIPIRTESDLTIVPLMAFGVRYGDFLVSANIAPRSSYSTSGMTVGDVTRSETDINFGYSILPNLMGSVVYKTGKVNQAATTQTLNITGNPYSYSIKGLLVGLSASAPLQDKLSLYGNFAVGLAREKADSTGKTYRGTYKIGEVGLSYRLLEQGEGAALKNLSLQLGYRFQNVAMRDFDFGTYAIPTGTLISTDYQSFSSTTQGLVLGLVGSF